MEAKRQDLMNSIGLLIIRVGAGVYMMAHGWGKVAKVLKGDFTFGDPIGIGEGPSLVLAAGAEFGCALLVVLGLATRAAAAPVVFTMLVAAFVAHAADPWTAGEGWRLFQAGLAKHAGSKEMAMLFLFMFSALIFTGAGKFSVDGMIWPRIKERRAKARAAGK